ncbi:membrane protein [Cryobacterium roopkundense]|uniref:Drug/metabolite transporter (DMT)-like permease n=1 Tax=Cryobacterium roopkundense TaxID=1001240 RepID=A0A099J3W9_9MICO|nr:EamA family transporter [Cryobacterium roopkundense]KGJ72775.1 membrane protein [Cryobacterium roopkundense]MBB5643231.1 drug/metabolite transporter (DMT)-like permease [Cryobacterium roopkundense]
MTSPRVLLAGLGVVVLWASAFPAIRVAAPELGVAGLSFIRLLIAAVALIALAPMLKVRMPARRDLPLILGCAFLGMAAYQVLLNWGELYVPAGTASIIVSAAPLVSVAIAAGLFGERLTALKIAGSAVAIAGVAMVSLARSGFSLSGAVWILIAAMVVQGAYHPLTKPLLKKYSGLEVATYGMIAGTLMLAPTVPFAWDVMAGADASAWWAAVYLGLAPSALGFVLWGFAVSRMPVVAATSLLYLVPPVAVGIAFVWLGELPLVSELAGGVVVIAGVVTMSVGDLAGRRVRSRAQGMRRAR